MNPGKRRKLQKIEFIKKMVEENVKKLEVSLQPEIVVQKVVEERKEVIQEELELNDNVIEQAVKRKKKTS